MVKQLIAIVAILALSGAMAQTRWEYAKMYVQLEGAHGVYYFEASDINIEGAAYDEFYAELAGGQRLPGVLPASEALVNVIGMLGWQLIEIDRDDYWVDAYTFRRPLD